MSKDEIDDEDIVELKQAVELQNRKSGARPAMNVWFNPDRYGVEKIKAMIERC